MKYHPKPQPQADSPAEDDGLFDVAGLGADLPPPLPVERGRLQKMGDQGLDQARQYNPRAMGGGGALPRLILLAACGYALFGLIGLVLPGEISPLLCGAMGLLGLVSGGALLWKSFARDDDVLYTRTYLFLFLSGGLAVLGYLPQAILGEILAPLLVGYGLGSYLAIVLRLLIRPSAPAGTKTSGRMEGASEQLSSAAADQDRIGSEDDTPAQASA